MVSFAARRILGTISRIVVLAVVAAPYAAFPQPNSSVAEDALQEIVERIDEIQSLQGVNSPDLIDPLTELSSFYEDRGDPDLALAVIERAIGVIEVNYGLHTLDEAQLMKQSIRIEEARGNAEAAWNQEQSLLALVKRNPNDSRTVRILHEIADKRMAMLARYESGEEFPPQIVLGCYYSEWNHDGTRTGCSSGNRRTVIFAIRREADAYRAEAANVAYRREVWVGSPCARPQVPDIPDGELSRGDAESAKTQVARYLGAMSDYVSCMQVKSEHAKSTNAPPEELSQLAADRSAAVREMEERRAIYQERFGPIKPSAPCSRMVVLPPMLRSFEDLCPRLSLASPRPHKPG